MPTGLVANATATALAGLRPQLTAPTTTETGMAGPQALVLTHRLQDRLAAPHTGATARLDSETRANLAPVLRALGWEPGFRLVLRLLPGARAEVTATTPGAVLARTDHVLTPDQQMRLRLPAHARAWLEVIPGGQLAALALPAAGRLLLGNPDHLWLALLAGECPEPGLTPSPAEPTPLPQPAGPRRARGAERVPEAGTRPLRVINNPSF